MKFECPDCGQPLETDTLYAGQAVKCPACGSDMTTPVPNAGAQPSPPAAVPSVGVIQTLQSSIDRGSMTISRYMAEKQIEGVIDLQSTEDKSSASSVLTAEQGRKYKLGDVVATGGMGAILNAKDVNLRRAVAMKVMLDPDKVGKDQILRFIQEAQVTSQIEHPSIVPIYELGVDGSGNVFYTMKFVKGRTLSDILEKIHDGDTETIRDYPLSHLLTIFQKVCDAIAFAHSKRVIHRDLKPENVMIGDYGEVQVMDWGLAKVLPKKRSARGRSLESRVPSPGSKKQGFQVSGLSPQPSPAIDSVRSDEVGEILKTMDGSIMGTPGFMSPEQAMGKTDEIDERTDIYALGAILYNILTLNVPVTGKSLAEIINKVTKGEIKKPTEYNRTQKRPAKDEGGNLKPEKGKSHADSSFSSLPHLPDNRVPESLSAVAMRALEVQAHRRYQKVKDLQKEIAAYQGGFATKAEDAGAWKQFALFVKRNKAVSFLVLSIVLLVAVASVISTTQWIKAEKLKREANDAKVKAENNYNELKGTAPALVAQSAIHVQNLELDKALQVIRYACKLVPESAEYRVAEGNILEITLKLSEAEQAYLAALKIDPANKLALKNKNLCRKLSDENKDQKKFPFAGVCSLYIALREQGRFDDCIVMLRAGGKGSKDLEALFKTILQQAQINSDCLSMDANGLCRLDLSGTAISDLAPLRGIPLTALDISRTKVTDLSPLKGLPLTRLKLLESGVNDLKPLRGMRLEYLKLHATNVRDISPLAGMPLKTLDLQWSRDISDISVLRGMQLDHLDMTGLYCHDFSPLVGLPLKFLSCSYTELADLTLLKGMPLKSLWLNRSKVTDLTPLKDLPLEFLDVTVSPLSDISPLAGHKTLQQLWLSETRVADIRPVVTMSLKLITLKGTLVTDVTPLSQCPTLEGILLPAGAKGIEALRKLPNLKRISFREPMWIDKGQPASDFWKEFDAKKGK